MLTVRQHDSAIALKYYNASVNIISTEILCTEIDPNLQIKPKTKVGHMDGNV